jgi:carbon monoxide dehydrogenase subunit G
VIDAPQEAVFEVVNGFERFNEWSPWFGRDPQAEYSFEGPRTGVGAAMAWTSQHPEVGNGRQEIVESEPPRWVRIAFDFGRQGSAAGSFTLRPEGEGTHVTWAFDTDLGSNPLARYFGLVLDDMIGPAYEKGLANLKKVAEAVGQ